MQLVECVANFSEGQRRWVIDEIAAAISVVPGNVILDQHIDPDHNRAVISFAAEPRAILLGAFQGIAAASRLIDMEQHRGVHPRLGAADVIPFIPLEEISLHQCVEIARQLGEKVGTDLQLPVYLYEAAAQRPDRRNLADVRRGEYEGLKLSIATDPNRFPDFGPAWMNAAGAVIIGARNALIAFNVYLTTNEVDIARKIAKAIRYSDGGLPYVKALGLLVKGKAQVSMNLTDFTQTSLYTVMEMIRGEALKYGVAVESSELVGLIPNRALLDTAEGYLQLSNMVPDRVLEHRLQQRKTSSTTPLSPQQKLESRLSTPEMWIRMETAVLLGHSPIEAAETVLSPEISDSDPSMIQQAIHRIMEAHGYEQRPSSEGRTAPLYQKRR